MIGASSLSGDTLIACHFPVVQLSTWRLPVQAVCGTAKRSSRLCPAGLTRAISLPEQDSLSREHALVSGRRHLFSSSCSLNEDRAEEEEEKEEEEEGGSDTTSSPEETGLKKGNSEVRGGARSRNPFLPCTELDEDEEDEDSDGDNLHRYHEDSSFVLQGNSNWPRENSTARPQGDMHSEWGNEGTMLGVNGDHEWLSNRRLQTGCFHASGSGVLMVPCGEQPSECVHSPLRCPSNPEYVTDSSCNSSDGVLVNFGAMYDHSNNPATPHDLSSPALQPSQSYQGSVFLNLQPVLQPDHSPVREDATPPAPLWSPQGLDSNCNRCSLEPLPPGLSSLEVSDLTACLQGQSTLSVGTNQKYYKLVTCDLSSQSPSPAWSSANCLEGPGRSSPFPPAEQLQRDERKDVGHQACDLQLASTSKHTDDIQDHCHSPCSPWPGPRSPHSRKYQHMSGGSVQPSGILNQEPCSTEKRGACPPENSVVRYSKSQRPTSLPIQPFVLFPADKAQTQAQHLGCLLDQYLNQKGGAKSGGTQPGPKEKGQKSSQSFSNLQPSPAGDCRRRPVFLDAASSSDTCSTCTPSPLYFGRRHTWSQGRPCPCPSRNSPKPGSSQATDPTISPNVTSAPKRSHLVKIPTYQDLIHLVPDHQSQTSHHHLSVFTPTPPTLPLTTDRCHPNLQVSSSPASVSQSERKFPPHRRATPAADSGFFHGSFAAALSSVGPLSSLGSLFSLAASGLHAQQTQDNGKPSRIHQAEALILSDKPPTEFCPSPDASYESLSISHLQRRGLLRSVSRAVDLIMAHFGSSRDPEEKMRLGNSTWSPTIAGLVLEHLCPTIQNILEDGLRDHKLDLIVGQRRNHSWTLVEISTRIGPSTRVLHSLLLKIKQCPELSSHSMRLRAFIMGLLNLRALEFWLSHLQSQISVITTYYHSWGFLSMSIGRCHALFQELLLLLQPLSVLPFDLNLLLEPRLLRHRQPGAQEQGVSPPQPCSGLLATSWPRLQADRRADGSRGPTRTSPHTDAPRHESPSPLSSGSTRQQSGGVQGTRSPWLATIPEWWQSEREQVEGVDEGEDCSRSRANAWSQISMDSVHEETSGDGEGWAPRVSASVRPESPSQDRMRWARLFGASSRAEAVSQKHMGAQTWRRPSHWLHLDRSQLGLLAQSIRSMRLVGAEANKSKDH